MATNRFYKPIDVMGQADHRFPITPKTLVWMNTDRFKVHSNRMDVDWVKMKSSLLHHTDLESADDGRKWLDIRHPSTNGETLESALNAVLQCLTLKYDACGPCRWELCEGADLTSDLQRKVAGGFLHNMSNSRGRSLVQSLFSILFSTNSDVSVHSVGRGSITDPLVKTVYFYPIYDESSASSCSSQESTLEKQKLSLASPSSHKRLKLTPGIEEKPKEKDRNRKCFVPDVVVEQTTRNWNNTKELLNISVKSKFGFTSSHLSQLKFELLPVVVQDSCALGMIICASEAYLFKYIKANNNVTVQLKMYDFTKSLPQSFTSLFVDAAYHIKNLAKYSSNDTGN